MLGPFSVGPVSQEELDQSEIDRCILIQAFEQTRVMEETIKKYHRRNDALITLLKGSRKASHYIKEKEDLLTACRKGLNKAKGFTVLITEVQPQRFLQFKIYIRATYSIKTRSIVRASVNKRSISEI